MIIHYVRDHHWQPPAAFIDNVMNHQLTGGSRAQSKGIGETYSTHRDAIPIGYLTGQFETGNVPDGFIDKLVKLMKQADEMSLRLQTRGI